MRNFLKKIKTLFMILLIFPMMFVFSSCGKDKDDAGSNSGGPSIEQPEGGNLDNSGGSDDGDDPQPEVQADKFIVAVNYNLPAFYEGLLPSKNENALVTEGYTLTNFEGTEYKDYFDGWFFTEDDSAVLEQTINAEKDQTISVYAKWKESEMSQKFATKGLVFEFGKDSQERDYAVPISYSGTSSIVIIPQVVMKDSETPCYVESIGQNCFKDNQIVEEVRTNLIDFSVENNAFENSTLKEIDWLKIKSIGESAFRNTKIVDVYFKNKLSNLSASAFRDCVELESAIFFYEMVGAEINVLPDYVFAGCSKLSSIELSSSITTISQFAFSSCVSLADFSFIEQSNVVSLGTNAFENCVKLDNIVIPERIVSYGTGNVFAGCTIKNITLQKLWYSSANGDSATFSRYFGDLTNSLEKIVLIGENISTIHKNYFRDYVNLIEVDMSNSSVNQIKNQAFLNCINMETVVFSNSVVADGINMSAFSSTKWYKNLELADYTIINNTLVYVSSEFEGEGGVFEIPNTVKYLSSSLFANNVNINKVIINSEIEYINIQAFVDSKIASAEIDENNEFYSIETYESNSALYTLNGENKESLIAYFASSNGGVFVIPMGVSKVYDYAFDLKYAPEYVFVRDENVDVVFDSYSNTSYIFENDTITSDENVNIVEIYRLLTQEEGGYSIVYKEDGDFGIQMPKFDSVEGLDKYNLVIIPNYEESIIEGEDPIYLFDCYYLVKILDSEVEIIELEGFCPYIEE